MANTATIFNCIPLRSAPELKVTFPGIEELQGLKSDIDKIPSAGAAAMLLLGQLSPALSPLVAILRMVGVLTDITNAFKDVTNPIALAKDLENITKDLGFLAEFLPGIPYVKMLRDMLAMVESILRGLSGVLTRWATESAAIGRAIASAKLLGDPDLNHSAECATTRLAEAQATTQVSLGDVGQILKIIKLIADIISSVVPCHLPGISDIADAIDTLATVLVSAPGTIGSSAEIARMLSLAQELTHIADEIHHLYVLIVEIVGT